MEYRYDLRLIVRCVKMHYEENLKQNEIADRLGISKATVSRIINYAKEVGIVEYKINTPYPEEILWLEKELEKKYRLMEVIIADVESDDEWEIKRAIAREAAKYLNRILKPGMLVGVSSGTTLAEIPRYIENNKINDYTFVPMVGGNGQYIPKIQTNNIALNFARVFKADAKILHAPAMVERIENKRMLVEDPGIKNVLSLTEKLDVALMGIGSSSLQSTVKMIAEFLNHEELAQIQDKGAVADVCNIFVDKDGNGEGFESNDRVIGVTLENIKKTPIRVGVAGHMSKMDAICGVVKTKIINVLITDIGVAKALVERG
ncbi:sugar-binding transcriptional regulator [Alkalibacter rhizosphaerae]|uniref:Sugar-binding transcriptional regulator n=1 Tax=Alkalibacter rhizosphaerae TaxID=2815577 RepID=A0A975AID0_9FIRM|nr:sugar-binding transcriptional regulator [Alkalibacter rhizosphaerae]QSX08948.1 sugar-binding transcriptional regulator [Alkalibacter rhizosphaerae]